MTRPGLSLGLFGLFGRSLELRKFDKALRSVDLHPNLVPEAVKCGHRLGIHKPAKIVKQS
jgi:hypothetical protein